MFVYIIIITKKMQTNNGRVNILAPKTSDLFKLYDKIQVHHPVSYQNPTEGLWMDTPLSVQFFSAENIKWIQENIQQGVLKKSNGKFSIGIQDQDQLKIVMRSIFLQYSRNQDGNIEQQVNQLNQLVLSYCIPQIYSEAISYKKYLHDVSNMYKPMDRPVLAKRNKTLEYGKWF
jgi:Family of unknown function (DUF5761)